MCYTVQFIEKRIEKYAERFRQAQPSNNLKNLFQALDTHYLVSGFSHPTLPIIINDTIAFGRWGLIPNWVKTEKEASLIRTKTLNAMGETLFEKPSFKKSAASKRAILGVNGFFEWRYAGKKKYPYFIYSANDELLALACIYDEWVNKTDGEVHTTFSVVTTSANELMAEIHNTKKRMPFVLNQEQEKLWVHTASNENTIRQMIQPCPSEMLKAHTITTMAGSSRSERNIAEISTPVYYPELMKHETKITF